MATGVAWRGWFARDREPGPGTAGGLRPREAVVSVLFADLAGYTRLTESLSPGETGGMMARLHRFFDACADRFGGDVLHYAGDGAMLVFGLPDPAASDASRAFACARALVDGIGGVDPPEGAPEPLRLRVGAHHGPVFVSLTGGGERAHLTVSGDTVNVASRLQEVAKTKAVPVAVSRALLDAVQAGGTALAGRCAPLEEVEIRGRTGRVEVWIA